MPTRSSQKNKSVNIVLTDIKYSSTCLDLQLPRDLCCHLCLPQFDARLGLGKKSSVGKKRFRQYKSERWRCIQPWASKHSEKHATEGTLRNFYRVRKYLSINSNVFIHYHCAYKDGNKCKKTKPNLRPMPTAPTKTTNDCMQQSVEKLTTSILEVLKLVDQMRSALFSKDTNLRTILTKCLQSTVLNYDHLDAQSLVSLILGLEQRPSDPPSEHPDSIVPTSSASTPSENTSQYYAQISHKRLNQLTKDSRIVNNIKAKLRRKKFTFNKDSSRKMLAAGLAHAPSLSWLAGSYFIPCIIGSFLTEIDFDFHPKQIASMSPCRSTLSYILQEAAVDAMLELRDKVHHPDTNIFLATDHGNKKGLHHCVKILSLWDEENNKVKRITLDFDATGGTSEETSEGIHHSLSKLDLPDRPLVLNGQHGDAGGGGTSSSLKDWLAKKNRIIDNDESEYLMTTCTLHGIQLTLSNPILSCFGSGGLEKRNILQMLHSAWNLQQQYEWFEFQQLWFYVNGSMLEERMKQPVLTRWEYIGMAAKHMLDRVEQWKKISQSIINSESTTSMKNKIASHLSSLLQEPFIIASMLFLIAYDKSFFDRHFQWLKKLIM